MPKGIPQNGINKGQWKKGQISPRKGVLVSQNTRQKMREKKLGKKVVFSDKHKENLSKALMGKLKPWLKGIKRITPELRTKMIEGRRNKWLDRSLLKKSDRQNSGAYYEWRKNVKNRDNHKCKIYNKDCNGGLQAHHILSWRDHPELRYEINNGITLCKFHHPLKYLEEKKLSPYFTNLILESK